MYCKSEYSQDLPQPGAYLCERRRVPSCVAGHCWMQAAGQGCRSAPREPSAAFTARLSGSVPSTSRVWGRPRPLTSSVQDGDSPFSARWCSDFSPPPWAHSPAKAKTCFPSLLPMGSLGVFASRFLCRQHLTSCAPSPEGGQHLPLPSALPFLSSPTASLGSLQALRTATSKQAASSQRHHE